MKSFINPQTGQRFKTGRKQPAQPRVGLTMKELLAADVLPRVTVPSSTNYGAAAQPSLNNVYLNNALSCCVISESFHADGVTSGNNGSIVVYSDGQVIQNYSAIGGYDPNASSVNGENPTDNGCDENSAIDYWEANGFPTGRWLKRAVSLDPTNIEEVLIALYLFENLCFDVNLPDDWVDPFPSANGFIWDKAGPPDPDSGHSFLAYDILPDGNIAIATWGMQGEISPEATAYYAAWAQGGQLFTFLLGDMFYRLSQKSPAGYSLDPLRKYLNQL
jgi:hypothetical protein